MVYNQFLSLEKGKSADITTGINALKRNVIIMFSLLAADFLCIILLNVVPYCWFSICPFLNKTILSNAITFFSLFYYLFVILDSALAFYNLVNANTNSNEGE